MTITVKTFGICRDILGGKEIPIELRGTTVADLRSELISQYPAIAKLNSLFIAVNQSYSEDSQQLTETDEVALIPPVSGG
jgi:sulfur-carrier protein